LKTDEEIFEAALELSGSARAELLSRTLADDPGRRVRIEALLRAHERSGQFLQAPGVARSILPTGETAGDVIDRYTLVERIGEGGCGVVWRARQDKPLRRDVAFKVIKLGMDTQAVVGRFEAERQALALMDHPHIARVFDAGITTTGRPYFVMELVPGIPITRFCDTRELTIRQRLELFTGVCDAVQHAHQKGIIHRDLKPSNILVAEHDGVPLPKVIDFGIAKATQGRLTDQTAFTTVEHFIGTPAYMSPEQAERGGLDVDTRTDIYSLGVLLFELLTGRPPFDAKARLQGGIDEIRRRIREDEAPRPSQRLESLAPADRTAVAARRGTPPAQLAAQLSGDLDWIVMHCLEQDRTRRYESASALAADLRRHLRHEPVSARPPSRVYVVKKLIRRHRAAFAALTALAGVLVIGGGISTWQAVRATRAEREQSRLRATEQELRQRAERQERVARLRAYAADMNLAQQAIANDNLGLAKRLLDRHRPAAGAPDLRGWDWRYLWQLARSEATSVLTVKPHPVGSLALSPDGNWLVLGQDDGGELSLWHLPDRSETRLPAGVGAVHAAFSPVEPLLAMAFTPERGSDSSHRLRLWNTSTRQIVAEWATPLAPGPLAFSRDGQTLATAAGVFRSNRLVSWRIPSGERIADLPATGGVIAVTPDARFAARDLVRPEHGTLQMIDLASGEERWRVRASEENFTALTFSPDGAILASADGNTDPSIRLWDAATGRALGRLEGHRSYIAALAFGPDGRTLVSAGTDQTVRLWDLQAGQLRRTLRGHTLEVHSVALLPDQTTLVSGAKDGAVFLWDTTSPAPRRQSRIDAVTAWRFGADSRSIVVLDPNGRLNRHDGDDFSRVTPLLELGRRTPGPQRTALAADAPLAAVVLESGEVAVFDWHKRSRVQLLNTTGLNPMVIGFTPGARTLLLAYDGGSPNDTQLHEWEVAAGRRIRGWISPAPGPRTFTLSADGRWGTALRTDDSFTLVDLKTREERRVPIALSPGPSPSFSPDGTRLVTTSTVGWARVWELAPAKKVAELSGFVLGVHSADFSPDGGRLITGSGGREAIRVWDVESFEPLLSLSASGTVFSSSAFSPDGTTIAARNALGQLHIWRAPSWQEIEAAERPR